MKTESTVLRQRPSFELRYLTGRSGCLIPVRSFVADNPKGAVVIAHGLQSHSGWFEELGVFLSENRFSTFAFDRRGSGLSKEPRGDCRDFREMIDDIDDALQFAWEQSDGKPLHLLGHCFGSIPAAAHACLSLRKVHSLILATPGLYTKLRFSPIEMAQIALYGGKYSEARQIRLPFTTEDLSELPSFGERFGDDPLMLRWATTRFYWQVRRMRRLIRKRAAFFNLPVLMMLPGSDPIGHEAKNIQFFNRLPSQCRALAFYPDAKHLLDYSHAARRYRRDLFGWLEWHSKPTTAATRRGKR